MEYINQSNIFASTYDSGTYDGSTYGSSTTTSTTAGGGSPSTGVLTDTGFDLVLAATIAVALISIALVIRFWRKPRYQTPPASTNISNKAS